MPVATELEVISARLERIENMLQSLVAGFPEVKPHPGEIDVEIAKVKSMGIDLVSYYKGKAKADPEYKKKN